VTKHEGVDRYELQRLCDANANPPRWEVRDLQRVEKPPKVSALQYSIAVNDVSTRDRKLVAQVMSKAKQGFVNYIHPEVNDADGWNQQASACIEQSDSGKEILDRRKIIEAPRNLRWALKDGDSGVSIHMSFQLPLDANPYVFLSQIFADHSRTLFTNERPSPPFLAFSEDEVQDINDLHSNAVQAGLVKIQQRGFGEGTGGKYGFHSVAYIHEICGEDLLEKFKSIVQQRIHNWAISKSSIDVHIKKVEYIRYDGVKNRKKGTRDQVGWHTDTDNLFTLIIMLSDDFKGGQSEFLVDGKVQRVQLAIGECILFPGEICQHRVAPILSGTRKVLCIEFWDQPKPSSVEQCLREFTTQSASILST